MPTYIPAGVGATVEVGDIAGLTKGSIIAGQDGDPEAELLIGTNGQVLTAASGETTGLEWAATGAGAPHAASHTDGTDDIQNATAAQKGVATAAQVTKLDAIESGATADQSDAEIKTAYENNADTNEFSNAEQSKLSAIEASATADQSDAEIETAYNNQVSVVSQGEAEAGTATARRGWTAERVKQAIAALESASASIDVNQTTHGLVVGEWLRNNGTIYVKAQADTTANAEVFGVITAVADVDNFTLSLPGFISGLTGITKGDVHFLSGSVAGALTTLEPTISKPILFGDSTTSGFFVNMRGLNATLASAGGTHAASHTDGTDDIQDATAAQKGVATAAQITKLDGIETSATADQSDAEIEAAYNNQVAAASQVEAEAGTEVAIRRFSPLRIAQAIAALETVGGLSNVVEDLSPQSGGIYETNNFQMRWSKGADIASATNLVPGTDGNYYDVTGGVAIETIATLGVGNVIRLQFDATVVLTHDATDLILPTGADITAVAGDHAEFVEYATGDWRCTNYQRADGTALVDVGEWEFIAIDIITSSTAQSDFTLDSSFKLFRWEFIDVVPVASARFKARVSIAGVFKTDANYAITVQDHLSIGGISNTISVVETKLLIGNHPPVSPGSLSGYMTISNPASSIGKNITGHVVQKGSTQQASSDFSGEYLGAATAIDGMRFFFDAINISSGRISMFGLNSL